jgi:hypothetical protein
MSDSFLALPDLAWPEKMPRYNRDPHVSQIKKVKNLLVPMTLLLVIHVPSVTIR